MYLYILRIDILILSSKPKQPEFAKQNPSSDRVFFPFWRPPKLNSSISLSRRLGEMEKRRWKELGRFQHTPGTSSQTPNQQFIRSCCFFYLVGLGESLRYAPAVGFLSENWVLNSYELIISQHVFSLSVVDNSNGSCSVGLVSEEMSLFELSPSRFIFVGFSAGGSLAAFTALVAPWQIGREAV